jgi:hypothetical protein
MPMTDSLAYLHGTGTTGPGPLTSTANAASSAAISGTVLTVTTQTTGQEAVGQQVNGAGVTANTYITSLGTGTGVAGTYNVNNSQTVSGEAMTFTPNTIGDVLCQSGSQYSNLELDFGAPNSGLIFPSIPQFPSLTEKTYTAPPEVVGQGGVDMGLHFIVTAAFNLLTSINFEAVTSATTGALYTASPNPIAARTLTLAQLQVVGAHYYLPVQGSAVLEFLRFYAALTGSSPTAGAISSWYGPRTGGEQ